LPEAVVELVIVVVSIEFPDWSKSDHADRAAGFVAGPYDEKGPGGPF